MTYRGRKILALICLILSIFMVLSLVACGDGETPENINSSSGSSHLDSNSGSDDTQSPDGGSGGSSTGSGSATTPSEIPGTGDSGDNPGTGDSGDNPGTGDSGDNPGTGDSGDNPGTGDSGDNPGTGDCGDNPGTGDGGDNPGTGDGGDNPGTTHTHVYGEWVVKEDPTCTEAGRRKRYCECGSSESDTIPATGHTEQNVEGYDATCTEDGLTDGVKCSVCNADIVKQNVISAKGHTDEVIKGYDATCTEEGLTDGARCTVCGNETKAQEPIQAKGHTEEAIKGYDATCTEDGLTDGVRCSVCKKVLVEQKEIKKKGHQFDDSQTCTVCGFSSSEAIVLTLDLSSSMKELLGNTPRIYALISSVKAIIENLDEDVQLSIIGFDAEAHEILKMQRVGDSDRDELCSRVEHAIKHIFFHYYLNADGTESEIIVNVNDGDAYISQGYIAPYIENRINTLATGEYIKTFGTGYLNAINASSAAFEGTDAKRKTLVFVSDGEPMDAGSGYTDTVARMAKAGVVTFSVGIVRSSSSQSITKYLSEIAASGNGAYRLATDEGMLFAALKQIMVAENNAEEPTGYVPSKGLAFELTSKGIVVAGIGACTDTEIKIPYEVYGIPVVGVGVQAFYTEGCEEITSITIPSTVTSFGNIAFYPCTSLKDVYYLGTLEQWCQIDFGDTHSNPMGHGENLYINGELITELVIPDTITVIKPNAFDACENITSIVIPSSVERIESKAFYGCTSVYSIVIPESVTFIMGNAFTECFRLVEAYNLSSLDERSFIPNLMVTHKSLDEKSAITVTEDGYVFAEADNGIVYLMNYPRNEEELILPSGEYQIHNSALWNNTLRKNSTIKKIILPNGITSLSKSMFTSCTSLEYNEYENGYYLGTSDNPYYALIMAKDNSITSISVHSDTVLIAADALTMSLGLATIPNSVLYVGRGAFRGFAYVFCAAESKPEGWDSYWYTSTSTKVIWNCKETGVTETGLKWILSTAEPSVIRIIGYTGEGEDVVIPDTINGFPVTEIIDNAFNGCTTLKTLTIGKNVLSIGSRAFCGCTSLQSLTIGRNVEDIGTYAFCGCTSLESILLPNGVVAVGNYAFDGCTSAKTLIIGKNVETLGNYAFRGCTSFESVLIPNEVTSIGNYAFEGCTAVKSITIGANVKTMGTYAFSGCTAVTELKFNAIQMDDFLSRNYWLEDIGANGDGISVTIGKNVKKVPARLLDYGTGGMPRNVVKSVVFEEGSLCESIGSYAFCGCDELREIVIPESVVTMGSYAIYQCGNLTIYCQAASKPEDWASSWHSGGSVIWDYCQLGVTEDGFKWLVANTNKTEVRIIGYTGNGEIATVPTEINNLPVRCIAEYAFNSTTNTKMLVIPSSITSIEAFATRSGGSLVIFCQAASKPEGWASNWNYGNCPVVWDYCEGGATEDGLVWATTNADPDSVILAGYSGMASSIIIPEKINNKAITSICERAFYNNKDVTSVTIPKTITAIGNDAFYGMSRGLKVYVDDIGAWCKIEFGNASSNPLNTLVSELYIDNVLTEELYLPNDVTEIKQYAFNIDSTLYAIHIPSSVVTIETNAIKGILLAYCEAKSKPAGWSSFWSSGASIIWNSANNDKTTDGKSYVMIDGVLYTLTSYSATVGTQPKNVKNATIHSVIEHGGKSYRTTISNRAFSNCANLVSVVIEDGISSIGANAFSNCANLVSVIIEDGIISIGGNAFSYCTSLESIVIPDSVTRIEASAFSGCKSLESVTIGRGVESIGSNAFSNCTSLASISIPANVTIMGARVFYGCNNLTINCEAGSQPEGWNADWNLSQWNEIIDANWGVCAHLVEELDYPATCETDGLKDGSICVYCGTILSGEVIPAFGHDEVVYKGCLPTCEEDGFTDEIWCNTCNLLLAEREVIPATGHTEKVLEEKEPTCEDTGLTEGLMCTTCYETLVEQEVIPATGHTEKVLEEKEPTCEDAGLTEGLMCTVCSEILVEQKVIPAKGHTENVTKGKEPTCEQAGLTDYIECDECGKVLSEHKEIPATGHTEKVLDYKQPTCEDTGLTEGLMCTVCSEILVEQEVIPATGHTEKVLEEKQPTCEDAGVTEGLMCTVCSEILVEQEVIPATGHMEMVLEAKEPTCESEGLTEGIRCTVCKAILKEQKTIDALGHEIFFGGCTRCDYREFELSYSQDLEYELSDDGTYYTVTDLGDCEDTSVIIPRTYDGLPVKAIGEMAFFNYTELESIIITINIEYVGSLAFYNCTSLVIYCEADSEPSGWDSSWNDTGCPVYWYSEAEPSESGSYWHYGENGEIIVW